MQPERVDNREEGKFLEEVQNGVTERAVEMPSELEKLENLNLQVRQEQLKVGQNLQNVVQTNPQPQGQNNIQIPEPVEQFEKEAKGNIVDAITWRARAWLRVIKMAFLSGNSVTVKPKTQNV